jgi:hypothetical protein
LAPSAPGPASLCMRSYRAKSSEDGRLSPGKAGIQTAAPKGARNLVTRVVEALIEGQGEALGPWAPRRSKRLSKAIPPCCAPYRDGSLGSLRVRSAGLGRPVGTVRRAQHEKAPGRLISGGLMQTRAPGRHLWCPPRTVCRLRKERTCAAQYPVGY